MDPLSITASVIAVLQAANAIISFCYDFKAILDDSPWSLSRIIVEIKDLRHVLQTLELLAEEIQDSNSNSSTRIKAFDSLCEPNTGPLLTCQQELKDLNRLISSRFDGHPKSKRRALMKAMGWQVKENDIKLKLERIERCKSTLSMSLTVDEALLLLDIRNMTSSLTTSASAIGTTVDKIFQGIEAKEISEKRLARLRWLSPSNPWESHEAAIKVHHQGTNSWFVTCTEFRQWYSATRSFLWLSGFPGAGKTVLFSNTVTYVSQKLRDVNDDAVQMAFFYCDFRTSETQDVVNMLGSLVAQLCSQTGKFPDDLEEAFCQSQNELIRSKRPTLPLLKKVLATFAAGSKIILMVDALDECQQRQEAFEFFSEVQKTIQNLRVLVTSRDEVDIQEGLHSFHQFRIEGHLDEVSHDIRSYIYHRLSSDRELRWLNESVRDDIATILMEKSTGMFRWVQCQIDEIAKLRTVKAIRLALHELPTGLYGTYDRILARVLKPDIEAVRRILLWVSFTMLPLTLSELHEAIAIEPGLDYLDEESRLRSPQDILDLCSSLASVSEHGYVNLSHLSVNEYLLSVNIRKEDLTAVFALQHDGANYELAKCCLTYLCFTEFKSGPCNSEGDFAERLIQYPLLKYVALCWPYFVCQTQLTPELHQLISDFFSPNFRSAFMSWVQVLNSRSASWEFYPRHATPLYYAASFGLADIVRDMIGDPRVDLNAPGSRFGGTALHAAVLREYTGVMKLLLDAGADPNQADWNQDTPLHSAALYGNKEVIHMLLEYGASADVLDGRGMTPLDWATEGGELEASGLVLMANHVQPQSNSQFSRQVRKKELETLSMSESAQSSKHSEEVNEKATKMTMHLLAARGSRSRSRSRI